MIANYEVTYFDMMQREEGKYYGIDRKLTKVHDPEIITSWGHLLGLTVIFI
jgi:hypothetical protein